MNISSMVGAFGAALLCLYAAMLAAFVASTQMVIDPATHEAVYAPWWTLFHSFDGIVVLGLLLAALGLGWLAWRLCRWAFSPHHRGPDSRVTAVGGGLDS